jgi:hypothetical protein
MAFPHCLLQWFFTLEEQSMRMLELLALVLVSLSGLSSFGLTQSPAARIRYNFNSGWRVLVGDPQGAHRPEFDDSQWKQVTTPYAWNEDAAFRVSIHDLPVGVAWYRKTLPHAGRERGAKGLYRVRGHSPGWRGLSERSIHRAARRRRDGLRLRHFRDRESRRLRKTCWR